MAYFVFVFTSNIGRLNKILDQILQNLLQRLRKLKIKKKRSYNNWKKIYQHHPTLIKKLWTTVRKIKNLVDHGPQRSEYEYAYNCNDIFVLVYKDGHLIVRSSTNCKINVHCFRFYLFMSEYFILMSYNTMPMGKFEIHRIESWLHFYLKRLQL